MNGIRLNENGYLPEDYLQECRKARQTPVMDDILFSLSASELKTYLYYAMVCTMQGYCHESDGLLSDVLNISRRSISLARRSLKENGYINQELLYSDKHNNVVAYVTMPYIENNSNYSHNYRLTDAKALRIYQRDNFTCQNPHCNLHDSTGAKLQLDHIIPASRNGSNDDSNMQVLCFSCNLEKGNMTMIEYLELLEQE